MCASLPFLYGSLGDVELYPLQQEPHGPDYADPQVVLGSTQAAFPQANPLVYNAPPPDHPEAVAENL
jgi:hypothetical protein